MAATLPNVMLQFGSETASNCQIGMAENNKEVNTALEGAASQLNGLKTCSLNFAILLLVIRVYLLHS